QSWRAVSWHAGDLGWVSNQNVSRRHHPSADPDRLRLSGSRPALLVSHSCHRRCHWYRLLRRRVGPVVDLTRHKPADRRQLCPTKPCTGSSEKWAERIAFRFTASRAVAFAMTQPEDVDVNEILYRPTRQEF